jgi:hypothetical protein
MGNWRFVPELHDYACPKLLRRDNVITTKIIWTYKLNRATVATSSTPSPYYTVRSLQHFAIARQLNGLSLTKESSCDASTELRHGFGSFFFFVRKISSLAVHKSSITHWSEHLPSMMDSRRP